MSLRIDRRELSAALGKVKPVIQRGSPLPILRMVLLRSRPDASTLTISGTDLRCSVSVEIACETGAEPLAALVDHPRLSELCASEWAETLEVGMEEAGEGRLVVRGETQSRLALGVAEDYPEIAEPPEGGEWMGLRGEAVEAMSRAERWCLGEDERKHRSEQTKFVWVFGAQVGKEPVLGVMGAGEHAGLCRYLPGVVDPSVGHALNREGAGCLAVGKEAVGVIAGLAGGEGIEVLDAEGKHFFRGDGWWASEVKGETDGADIRRFLDNPSLRGDGMRPLPSMVNLLKVLEAAPRRVAGIEKRVMMEVKAVSPEGSRCYINGPDVSWSGEIAADLPPFRTYKPEELVDMLRELDRIAGTDGVVEVGTFMRENLRFEIEDRAVAFVMGVAR